MKLSIVTITYNNKLGLQKTIDNILSQTYSDFEWIVIDGGSTDGSVELLKSYQSHFDYWCSEPDRGVYNAQNKGISKATAAYVCCMNAGDVFVDSNTLNSAMQQKFEADIVYGDWIRNAPSGREYKKAPSVMTKMFLFTDNVCHQSMFVKTELLKNNGFDESMKIFADWKKWREFILAGATFQYLNMPICLYDTGGLSDTPSMQNSFERKLLHDAIPSELLNEVEEHEKVVNELWNFKSNTFLKDTYTLIYDKPLYCHFIKLNLQFLKMLKRIVDKLGV